MKFKDALVEGKLEFKQNDIMKAMDMGYTLTDGKYTFKKSGNYIINTKTGKGLDNAIYQKMIDDKVKTAIVKKP